MPTLSLESLKQLLQDPHLRIRNNQLNKYFIDLISCLWNTVYKGYFFDSEWFLKQLYLFVQAQKESIGDRIIVQLCLLQCEFWMKRKKKEKVDQAKQELMRLMEQLEESDISQLVERYNSLMLFGQKIDLIEPVESTINTIIKLSDEGNIPTAIQELKRLISDSPRHFIDIQKILLGKIYLLQPNIQALEVLDEVAKNQSMVYESYLAKLLMIAGYKSLQKFNIDPSKYKSKCEQYQTYVKKYGNEEMDNKIQRLQIIFRDISKCDIPSQKLVHIGSALDLISTLPCYPSPSIVQLDLYLLTVSAKHAQNKLSEAKQFIERCKSTAQKLGIYSGSRQSKINYKLALIYEKEKKDQDALILIERCISMEFKQKELKVLYEMRERLLRKKDSLRNSMIYEEEEEGQEQEMTALEKVGNRRKGPVVNTENTQENQEEEYPKNNKSNVIEKPQELPQPNKHAINCCLLF